MAEENDGASHNERLMSAARSDNEELLLKVFEDPDKFDINHRDGLGNTALHYASRYGSVEVLDHLLSFDRCDVDLQNRLERDTPLHVAIKNLVDEDVRKFVIESLLEAGANTKIKNKDGDSAYDLVSDDTELRSMIRKAEALASAQDDIADDDDKDEDGSGSESEGDE